MINKSLMPKAYSEVYGFIMALGEEYKNQLPADVYNNIEEKRDLSYNPKYDINQTVDDSTFSIEALSLITALYLEYWCTDEKEKEEIKQVLEENQRKQDEKYSYENLWKNKKQQETNTSKGGEIKNDLKEEETKNTEMIKHKENILTKFINYIKKALKQ